MKIGPKYKLAKRLGSALFEKTQTQKYMLSEARYQKARRVPAGSRSEYGKQLMEKQKVRFTYGITERQFRGYVDKALAAKGTDSGRLLFEQLETRLDNVIYRMGLAPTRRAARQMVSHGHITINGRKITIPSYHVDPSDAIAVRTGSRVRTPFTNLSDKLKEFSSPDWVTFDPASMTGRILRAPTYDRTTLHFNIVPVLEYYTR